MPASQAAGRQLYVVSTESDGKAWQQLRLGFFATEQDAEAALQNLRARYPDAWVTRIGAAERTRAQTVHEVVAGPEPFSATRPSQTGTSTLTVEQLGAMMAEARSDFLAENFDRAILLYTQVLGQPHNAYSEEAQEFLGVAHDRNGADRAGDRGLSPVPYRLPGG